MNNDKPRIAWVDILKFLGIWAIYIAHFGSDAGKLATFGFVYRVPMFFFAAGFFSSKTIKEPFVSFLKKKSLQLMLPYAFFSAFALIVLTLQNNWEFAQIKTASASFVFGIRNEISAGSLWFIPTLYFVYILNYIVLKTVKSQLFSLFISAGISIASLTLLPQDPSVQPSWFMNIDSAFYYFFYFSLGVVMFPYLNKDQNSRRGKILAGVFALVSLAITVVIFIKSPAWLFDKLALQIPVVSTFKLSFAFFSIIIGLIIIYFNIVIAKLIAHISFLAEMGRDTLIFCGTENVMKSVFIDMFTMIGLKIDLINPLITVIFSLICLIVSKFTLVRFLYTYFPKAVGRINPIR